MSTVVQVSTPGSPNSSFASPVTAGNRIVAFLSQRDNSASGFSNVSGFDFIDGARGNLDFGNNRAISMWEYIVQSDTTLLTFGADSKTFQCAQGSDRLVCIELNGTDDYVDHATRQSYVASTVTLDCGGPVTPTAGFDAIVIGAMAYDSGATLDPVSGVTEFSDYSLSPHLWAGYRLVSSASGAYSVAADYTLPGAEFHGVTAAFPLAAPPIADFGWDASGFSVNFVDTSTNSPTSWSWDFGDGSTSTSQDPIHVYASPGSYSVTLTATNAFGSDSVTKTVTVTVTVDQPDGAGKATVEIYVHDPEGFKWDEATWDDAEWAASGWQDVTPESIDVLIRWGVADASLGILSVPDADSWAINFLDPQRKLDPANLDSPFYGDLAPFLPVRVNLDGYTVRTGIAEAIGHDWVAPRLDQSGDVIPDTGLDGGYMRVTNNIARMANATVPHDTELSNTLVARAVDALAACGLSDITVLPLASDPALVAWTDTGTDQTAWDWLKDACQQVLYQPYIDRHNQLGFREYLAPLIRLTELTDVDLTALASIVNYQSNYSVVTAGVETRALTPTPIYGKRTFTRDTTPDDATWAQTVLDDRSLTSLRWIPGETYTTTPTRSHELADVRAVEVITLRNDSTDPPVLADVIVLGGQIRISARSLDTAQWWFTYEAAQTAELPLAVDGSDPVEYITTEGGVDFLYAD